MQLTATQLTAKYVTHFWIIQIYQKIYNSSGQITQLNYAHLNEIFFALLT